MTVSTTYTPLLYAGNAATTAFSVTWPFRTGTLVVTLISSTGTETVKTLTTHYTVTGGTDSNGLPATGTVTMLTAPAVGESLRITRVTPKTQARTWGENDPFPQKTIEGGFDQNTLIDQETAHALNLALTQSQADYEGTGALTLPTPTAGKYLGWNSAANGLENKNAADYSLTVGTVTTGAPGTDASVTITGTATDGVLNLTIPRGNTGTAGAGTGDVLAAGNFPAANRIIKSNNTATSVEHSGVSIDASDNVSGMATLTLPNTGLHLLDTNASHDLIIAAGSDLTADRTLTITTGDANVGLDISGSAIAVDGVKARMAGRETIWIPALAMTPRTTNGAAAGTTELATNGIMLPTLDFDTTTKEAAGIWIAMPKNWNEGTVIFKAFWTAASGSGGVAWGLAGYAFSNDDAMDTAVSGQQVATDTLITANDMHVTSESSAITIGGTPAEGDAVYFELTREVSNGSDTLGVDAKLIGFHLYIITNSGNDA